MIASSITDDCIVQLNSLSRLHTINLSQCVHVTDEGMRHDWNGCQWSILLQSVGKFLVIFNDIRVHQKVYCVSSKDNLVSHWGPLPTPFISMSTSNYRCCGSQG